MSFAQVSVSGTKAVQGTQVLWSSRGVVLALVLLCIVLAALTSRAGLVNLYDRWVHEDEYGYGFLAAAIVSLLLWSRLWTADALSTGARWPGVTMVLIAQVSAVLGSFGESYFIEQIGFVLTLLGLVMMVFGTGAFRIFSPLAAILLLTIPLPYTLQAILTLKLQLLSTNIAVTGIEILGIPVLAEGNIIDLGMYKLQVAEACSGLRYLLPLTCFSFMLSYFYKGAWWKRLAIFVSAVPITVLINSFRLVVVALLVDRFGIKMAEGFIHEFEGWVIFLGGVLLLVLEMAAFEGFRWSSVKFEPLVIRRARDQASKPQIEQRSAGRAALTAVLLCLAALSVETSVARATESAPKPVREGFSAFPATLGEWSGREGQLEPEISATLKATDYYTGDFSEASNRSPVNLFVAYYDSLNKGGAIHSPKVCLPGSGWEFTSFDQRSFDELAPGTAGNFNRVIVQKGGQRILMYYWFQQRERRIADEFGMKYYLLVDGLLKGRKDGALVRIFTPIIAGAGNATQEADHRLQAFARTALPTMRRYLPE